MKPREWDIHYINDRYAISKGPTIKLNETVSVVEKCAFEKLKADAQLLKEALEICEKELFRFNCEAPLELTAIDKPVYLLAREALEKFNAEGWGK